MPVAVDELGLSVPAARPSIVCLDRGDPLAIARRVRDEGIGSLDVVTTQVRDLLTHPEIDERDLESRVDLVVGRADCPPESLPSSFARVRWWAR